MSLDPRSRERLEALGRQLPKPLPPPQAELPAQAPTVANRRHRVETEQDPRRLFHELMDVSPDGSVPPHLLDRLRQLEKPPAAAVPIGPEAAATTSPRRPRRDRVARGAEQDLYTAFQQLLLEDEEED